MFWVTYSHNENNWGPNTQRKTNIKALGNKAFFSPFFGGRIRLLYERLERISFWWGQAVSTCAVSHWAGMRWLYSPSPTHIVMFVQGCSCTLSEKTHWMYTHRILPAKWQCSINLVSHVLCVRYRSLHCHPFRTPILKRARPAYIHAYIEYVHI